MEMERWEREGVKGKRDGDGEVGERGGKGREMGERDLEGKTKIQTYR